MRGRSEMPVRRVISDEDSDVYHEVRGGRIKHGGTGLAYDRDLMMTVEEANRSGLRPCGNCWRQRRQRERLAKRGLEEVDDAA